MTYNIELQSLTCSRKWSNVEINEIETSLKDRVLVFHDRREGPDVRGSDMIVIFGQSDTLFLTPV